jgi:hypothetical protein
MTPESLTKAWAIFGGLVRTAFFFAFGAALACWVFSWDWSSALNTPLAQMNIGQLLGLFGMASLVIVLGRVWVEWAFNVERPFYAGWAWFGLAVGLFAFFWMGWS